jgi:CubicO group peptidase (beta-lactamase class C family)
MRAIASALLLAALVQAQPAQKQADVDRIFSPFNTHTPGCSVGVALHGAVVLKAGYGMADLERNVPITPDSVFESGSVAKQFTAAALLLLAQQGKISIDDPVRKYLPELPDYGTPLTIRQVLSHVSGLREWRAIGEFSGLPEGKLVYDNQDLLQMAARQRALNFEPGTDYSYTNTGFNISTILIERALGNGKTFQTFTREMIFEPLGMAHSRWRDDFRAVVPNRALAYERSQGDIWKQDTPVENIIGAGGLLTTVGDLLLWNENFTHPKVGGPELVRAQQTPATLRSGRQIAYAAGLVVSTFDGLPEVSHGGATGGYRTWLGRYPDQGVSVAVLCNSASANPAGLGRDTARLWTGAQAKTPSTYAADPAKSQSLAGMYRKIRDNTVMGVRWRNGKLALDPGPELVPIAAGKFLAAASEREFHFEQGTPIRLRVVTSTDDILYERVEPVQPTPAELAALTGEYESSETGTTLTVALDAKHELSYRIGSSPVVALRPTFRDSFATPSDSSIRFLRDPSGKVIALSAGEDRVWDLRFTRVRQPN